MLQSGGEYDEQTVVRTPKSRDDYGTVDDIPVSQSYSSEPTGIEPATAEPGAA